VKHFIRFLLVENQRYSPRPSSKQSDYSFDFHSDEEKRKKIQFSHQCLFTLLGSTSVKAVHRTLMKLSPGVHFTNILQAAFMSTDLKCAKNAVKPLVIQKCFSQLFFTDSLALYFFGKRMSAQKLHVKCR